jgi:hypothetical protein
MKLLLKISEHVHCLPMAITPLVIGFEHINTDWNVEEVYYEFDIELGLGSKVPKFPDC